MDIRLDLSMCCIETELRKQYNKAISAYFKAGMEEKRDLEQRIEMIRRALETLNFSQLRTNYAPLAGGTNQEVFVSHGNQDLVITIDGKKIDN